MDVAQLQNTVRIWACKALFSFHHISNDYSFAEASSIIDCCIWFWLGDQLGSGVMNKKYLKTKQEKGSYCSRLVRGTLGHRTQ